MACLRLYILLIGLIAFSSLSAQVQEELTPLALKQTTIITEPATLKKGFLRLGAAFSFSAIDKFFDDNAEKRFLPENVWARSSLYILALQYGLSDRLQALVTIPFRDEFVSQSFTLEIPLSNTMTVTSWELSGSGLGDMEFGFSYQLVPENFARRAVLFSSFLTLPTGRKDPTDVVDETNYTLPIGNGEVIWEFELLWRRVNYPYFYSFAVSYDFKFGGNKVFDVGEDPLPFQSGSLLTLNGAYNFHLNDWLAVQNDMFYFSLGQDELNGQTNDEQRWSVQYVPRLSIQAKRLRINQSVGFVLLGRNVSADPTYTAIVQYIF